MEYQHKIYRSFSSNKFTKVFFILLIAIAFVGTVAYYYEQKIRTKHMLSATIEKKTDTNPLMQRTTPAPLTARQKEQLRSQTSSSAKEKTFDILGGNFYFTPNKITVNQGDKVIINFISQNGMHDFMIDAFKVRTPIMQQGQIFITSFRADKKGIYQYYCNIPGHKEMGMKGTLIVQ